jgi:hypothetical protein
MCLRTGIPQLSRSLRPARGLARPPCAVHAISRLMEGHGPRRRAVSRIGRGAQPRSISRVFTSIVLHRLSHQYFTNSVWINQQPKGYPATSLPLFRPYSSILFDQNPRRVSYTAL